MRSIFVTEDDIRNGNNSSDACPITVALRRQFNNNKITVSRNFIRVPKKRTKEWKLIALPKPARDFMLNYHVFDNPRPFSFVLESKDCSTLER